MTEAILFLSGVILGIYGVVFGGALLFAIPLLQVLAPAATVGQIIGNLKIGSIARGVASTWRTWDLIDLSRSLKLAVPFVAGAVAGALLISDLPQYWILPAVLLAILVCEFPERLTALVGEKSFSVLALLCGLYTGILGAGVALLIVALIRVVEPAEDRIVAAKIDARFIEFLMALSAVFAHYWAGNLVTSIWLPWAAGSFVGGWVGATFLAGFVHVSARVQSVLLRLSYVAAILGCVPLFVARS